MSKKKEQELVQGLAIIGAQVLDAYDKVKMLRRLQIQIVDKEGRVIERRQYLRIK